jgi:two-component system chemotaxis sensor kinase CheA
MNTDLTIEEIRTAVEELRNAPRGPALRKQLDSLFRTVHNLKATAAADGLTELSHAAHELENILHELRTGKSTLDGNTLQHLTATSEALFESAPAIPEEIWSSLKAEEKHAVKQSIEEGANLLLVQTSFDVADFDQQFQTLKETLSRNGEVISVAPRMESEGKINFKILYASTAGAREILDDLARFPGVTVEELVRQRTIELLQYAVRAGEAAALATGKEVDFEVRGEDLSLDNSLREALVAPLLHLVRNAVDHGIEPADERVKLGKNARGKIVIEAATVEGQTRITVTDDGRGIDPAIISLLFQPGFSTAREVTTISGRGVGLDVVETTLKELGGSITVNSDPGKGSTFQITLPDSR